MKIKINGLYEKILLSIVATLSNSNDISSPNAPDYLLCTDIESGITFATKKTGTAQLFDDRYLFGNDADNASELVGSYGNDHFCGMGGNDTLNGHDGNDYLEGGFGDEDSITTLDNYLKAFNYRRKIEASILILMVQWGDSK